MSVIAALANLVGWRGAIGVAIGAMIAALPAYEVGLLREAAAGTERTARVAAEGEIRRMEVENARVDAAAAARLGASRDPVDGRLSDDGYRRD